MDFDFTLIKKDKKTKARVGIISTPHGKIKTPAFSPVGTKATVKSLDPRDLKEIKTQVVLGNAYHLYLRPGTETIKDFGGFAPFMNWDAPTITDSGGYQVSFLWSGSNNKSKPSIRDHGIYFKSHIDGSKHLLTAETSMQIQSDLAADIIMTFDQPMGKKYSKSENEKAYKRSFAWEERSYIAWEKNKKKSVQGKYQALFGIVQGQTDARKRLKFLKFILKMGFPGIAIGGESVGDDSKITAKSLDSIVDLLPDDKPVHALGLGGGPEGIFTAIERGVDIFDNSSVTRMARSGLLFIHPEDGGNRDNKFRVNILKSEFRNNKKPVSKICACYSCSTFSSAYINHLFLNGEILGLRLGTIHNVYFYNHLMEKLREAIKNGDYLSLRKHWLGRKNRQV